MSKDYLFAGVKSGGQCFCGNKPPAPKFLSNEETECNSACPGDNSAMCGETGWRNERMNVYITGAGGNMAYPATVSVWTYTYSPIVAIASFCNFSKPKK